MRRSLRDGWLLQAIVELEGWDGPHPSIALNDDGSWELNRYGHPMISRELRHRAYELYTEWFKRQPIKPEKPKIENIQHWPKAPYSYDEPTRRLITSKEYNIKQMGHRIKLDSPQQEFTVVHQGGIVNTFQDDDTAYSSKPFKIRLPNGKMQESKYLSTQEREQEGINGH